MNAVTSVSTRSIYQFLSSIVDSLILIKNKICLIKASTGVNLRNRINAYAMSQNSAREGDYRVKEKQECLKAFILSN